MPRLTYFSSRGLAEPIRLLLAEADVSYQAVHLGTWNPGDQPEDFQRLVASGRLPFGAVPLWEEDDGFSLVQSEAILRHLARTRGLYGATPEEAARADQIAEGIKEVRAELAKLRQGEGEARQAAREALRAYTLPRWMRRLAALISPSGFFGPQITYADVLMLHLCELMTDNELDLWRAEPALTEHQAQMADRPRLRRYLHSGHRFPPAPYPR